MLEEFEKKFKTKEEKFCFELAINGIDLEELINDLQPLFKICQQVQNLMDKNLKYLNGINPKEQQVALTEKDIDYLTKRELKLQRIEQMFKGIVDLEELAKLVNEEGNNE